jgi:tetratricopeptide (TPR) repeat protein
MSKQREIDHLLEDILVDAYGEDEQLWAFRQTFEDEVPLPVEGSVIGETVSIKKIEYDGNTQRGLRATCQKADGKTYEVALADVEFPSGSKAAPYIMAYRQWLGVPQPRKSRRVEYREKIKQTKAGVGEIDLSKPLDLIVLGVKKQDSARCRLLGKDKELTLRSADVWDVVSGEIVTVLPRKHWSYAGHPYLSADITGIRFDLGSLNLQPLKLNDFGMWDPGQHYWGEDDAPELDWEKAIKARGPRPEYEMDQILPGVSPEDLDIDTDPITEAVELKEAGEFAEAHQALNNLLIADLRCLDAHAHLGNLEFDRQPTTALRHYNIGRQIGEISLGPDFPGVLPWGLVDNRPYLRCLHGYGLCLWRLKRFDEAAAVFTRMLWLNPSDNQGVRFLLNEVHDGTAWEERADL